MAANDKGYTQGYEYIRGHNVERMTFSEYCKLGKVVAKFDYKKDKSRDQFALGWWQAGEQFILLFKIDPQDIWQTQRFVKRIQEQFGTAQKEIESLLDRHQGDTTLAQYLDNACNELEHVQETLSWAMDYLKTPREV